MVKQPGDYLSPSWNRTLNFLIISKKEHWILEKNYRKLIESIENQLVTERCYVEIRH